MQTGDQAPAGWIAAGLSRTGTAAREESARLSRVFGPEAARLNSLEQAAREDKGAAMATIHCWQRRLSDYASVVGPDTLLALRRLAEPLAGLRVMHLSAGPSGGAVAETLAALIPLQRDVGLLADWHVLRSSAPRVARLLNEGLLGASVRWRSQERAAWYASAERQAASVPAGYDVVVAHDPEAVAVAEHLPPAAGRPRWIWHCHLDPRAAQPDVWAALQHALQPYTAALFPAPELVRDDCPVSYYGIARPAIDPCSPKNLPLSPKLVATLQSQLGIDPRRPVIGQFAPIDRRYAPIAALGTYWLARQEFPGLQIVLVDLSVASSEPARRVLEQVLEATAGDPDVHVLTRQAGLGATEINALQRGVAVALQLAQPGGFGWAIAECQWKGRPVVVGRHGQLPEQVGAGRRGLVVEGAFDAAGGLVQLLQDSVLASEVGQRGREHVARDHLITRLLGDYLRLFRRILVDGTDTGRQKHAVRRPFEVGLKSPDAAFTQ